MKTLHVSDLDGTLLRSDQRTSDYTNTIINDLVKRGMLFSYATARSYNTSHVVTEGMTAAFPLIVYNGAFVKDNATGEMLIENFFDRSAGLELIYDLIGHGVSPIVYSFVDGVEKFSYNIDTVNDATKEFVLTRKGDSRDRPVRSTAELTAGDLFYVTCIDSPKVLEPLFREYDDTYHCVYQNDIYSGEQWLEIMPKNASKANAIIQLKRMLGCDRLVVFGDGVNDIDMFRIADEAYAVENAVRELKNIATGIIEDNNHDGVAHWLIKHCGRECDSGV